MQIIKGISNEYTRATLWDMMRGNAELPFQYRMLLPWIIKIIYHTHLSVPNYNLHLFHGDTSYFMTAFWVTVVFLMLLVLTFRGYLNHFMNNAIASSILSLTLFFVLPYNFIFAFHYPSPYLFPPLFQRSLFFIYDIPSMFFFTLAMLLMLKEKWPWYYPIFVLATFNRETTFFLIIIYLFIAFRNKPFKSIALHGGLQMAVWMAIKLLMYALYYENSGQPLTFRIDSNLHFLSVLHYLPNMLSAMGWIWIPVLLFYRRIPYPELRRSVLAFFPFAVSMFIVGNVFEFRIYGEFIPVILAAFWVILRQIMLQPMIHRPDEYMHSP